ncbi:hypothetical protein ACIGZJ_13025 [Kitasatospora sp. NPDC052868]|uniref:hypothetical protein n=1 Tax=Kitasatospora sp. NPDC052868 TaxID=3364060 RepID=UPI0037C7A232
MGYPLTDETGTPDAVVRFSHFETGSIYWTLETGASRRRALPPCRWGRPGPRPPGVPGRLGRPARSGRGRCGGRGRGRPPRPRSTGGRRPVAGRGTG